MSNEQSSPRPLKTVPVGNGPSTSIGNLYGGINFGDGTVTNHYNITEASGKNGKYKMWLDPPDSSINHNSALRKRRSDTGSWLLRDSMYKDWQTMTNSFLWLHGLSGSGKTILL
ncbi:hypothetical protein M378DRAFT_170665 [Amanita muscaria Koide BX008]|uniref:Nephrocystin 3-like N-terminal domain-containing protein n=1 Tax=Amanita muscaria (strain Koide BX008) TaxID=946122 RepID=A0A0C2S6P4_AMAMK|nr:hypothetical protein M378DRAFT_170665 [Amanita muscaria Koide BX008]